jgi:hypothetical protein
VTVRAFDPPTDRYIPRGKQYWEPQSRSIFYTRTSGIWQSVWMEAAGESYLEQVRITPALDGTVRFEGRILRPQPNTELTARIRFRDRDIATASGVARARARSQPRSRTRGGGRSIAEPHDVIRAAKDGTTLDRVTSYLDSEVGVEGHRMTLNCNPIPQAGARSGLLA